MRFLVNAVEKFVCLCMASETRAEKRKKALYVRAAAVGQARKHDRTIKVVNTGVNLEDITIKAREVC